MSDSSDHNIILLHCGAEDGKSERQGGGGGATQDNICRDYIRGICDRKFCKYKHENEVRPLNFCHDFQNNICPRPNCKFIHCTPEEVEEYKRTGEMSNQILAEATRKNQLPGTQPVCNQFRKGMCRRSVCKYRHITKEEEDAEILELIQNNSANKQRLEQTHVNTLHESQIAHLLPSNGIHRLETSHFENFEFGPSLPKRRFLQTTTEADVVENTVSAIDPTRNRAVFKGYYAGSPPALLSRVDARTITLEEEIGLLHKEIAQLKRQVSDLTATNEFLLDQNATLRVSSKRNGTVSMPEVTLSQNNNAAQPQPQVIRTVTASVATVPVSLATVTTCNPVSGNPVSIAGCPSVSIAQPAQILAPSQQILVTTNPTTQLAIANSSQAQLAIAQQNLANNLAQQAAQPQLTSQAQQLALASTTQQLTSQAQHIANHQQQLALANAPQQLTTSQAQQLALAQQPQQLTAAALANSTQQLTVPAQQLALAANTGQQLLASGQQLELHRNGQMSAISTSQAIAMSNATQPMVSYPIMTQSMTHALQH